MYVKVTWRACYNVDSSPEFLIRHTWAGPENLHFLQVPRCATAGLGTAL